jgi:hypothetical protein
MTTTTTTTTTTMTTKVLYEKWSNITSGQTAKHYIRSNGQTLQTVKRSNITSGQTVKHYISSNIRSIKLVLTKCLRVHIDWRTPLVKLSLGCGTVFPLSAFGICQ